jgi:hypothetical protein
MILSDKLNRLPNSVIDRLDERMPQLGRCELRTCMHSRDPRAAATLHGQFQLNIARCGTEGLARVCAGDGLCCTRLSTMELSPANSTLSLQIMQRAHFDEQDWDLTRSQGC